MNKKYTIAFFANTSHFFRVFMLNHIKQLNKKYNIIICCNNPYSLRKNISKNIHLIDIKYKRGVNFFFDIKALFQTTLFLFKKKPDLYISFTPKVGFIAIVASLVSGSSRRIHWFTGQVWATRKGFFRIFYKIIDKLIFYLSDKVLVDSPNQKKFLIKEKVISCDKSYVLNKGSVGGVNFKKFNIDQNKRIKLRKKYFISNNTFVFLYLGRINEEKGIIELIRAFKEIESKFDVLLILVGEVEDKSLFKLLNNNHKIRHFDYTTKPEKWFYVIDILCLPSHREGFGNVVIEAASFGIPTLCSNIYGLKDAVINGKTGLYHKVRSINDIKKKMIYVIKNKKLIKKYGLIAKRNVKKNFGKDLLTTEFLKFISQNVRLNENKKF